jgi:hypothetical protein
MKLLLAIRLLSFFILGRLIVTKELHPGVKVVTNAPAESCIVVVEVTGGNRVDPQCTW